MKILQKYDVRTTDTMNSLFIWHIVRFEKYSAHLPFSMVRLNFSIILLYASKDKKAEKLQKKSP